MRTGLRLALVLALGGTSAWAFAGWLRPEGILDLVAVLSLCR